MSSPRILLVRFSSLGDVLLTTPLIRALRARHPAATLTVLTKQEWAPLLSANPHLDEVIGIARGQSLVPLARSLRRIGFSHHLDLHASVRTRMLRLLTPGAWYGFDPRRRQRQALIRRREHRYTDHVPVAERYFEAASALDVVPDGKPAELWVSPAAEARAGEWLNRHGLSGDPNLVMLAPGAAHATKRWPMPHWRALAISLTQQGMIPVVVGGAGDREAGQAIIEAAGSSAASSAGELDLQATGALIRQGVLTVAGDTGPMHLATAVGTRVVALYGPTVEAFGFFPYQAEAAVLQQDLPCRPCSSKGSPRCPLGHHRCMEDILPSRVLQQVEQMLA